MTSRARSTARGALAGTISVYLEEDRIEIGTTDMMCQEQLSRIAYRDVRRILTWPDGRRAYLFTGVAFCVIGVVALLLALGMQDDPGVFAALLVGVGGAIAIGLPCMYAGRPDGITRIRIEGVRGSLDAVLAGSATKRAALLEDLERRVYERQSPR